MKENKVTADRKVAGQETAYAPGMYFQDVVEESKRVYMLFRKGHPHQWGLVDLANGELYDGKLHDTAEEAFSGDRKDFRHITSGTVRVKVRR